MRVFGLFALFLAAAVSAQQAGVCDLKDDECYDVINPNACYNQFRWNTRTLQCVEGKDDADRARKICKCCGCVGSAMCTWATSSRLCSGGGGAAAAGGGGAAKGKGGKKGTTRRAVVPRRGLEQ